MAKIRWHRYALWTTSAVAVAAIVWLMLRPVAIRVEVAHVTRGPMTVTVDEEGETRAHDRFAIAAPVPARMLRVALEEGDLVRENQVVAELQPLPLNQQQHEEILARIQGAEADERQANARVQHAREDYEQARRDRERSELLARDGIISVQLLEQSRNAEVTTGKELEAARFSALAAASEVKVARAGLLGAEGASTGGHIITLRSPISGRVLRVPEKSERVVQAGTPIVVVGDPHRIEVVVDVLTTDAVNISPGSPVSLEGWGGNQPLRAKVRLVEPAGFTKISALGVEEKRVNVIADFVDPPDRLGDGYRVEARIVIWQSPDILKVPSSATFRDGNGWSVFVIEQHAAHKKPVQIGHRNQTEVEVLQGLNPGEVVILHPPNQMKEGARVQTD